MINRRLAHPPAQAFSQGSLAMSAATSSKYAMVVLFAALLFLIAGPEPFVNRAAGSAGVVQGEGNVLRQVLLGILTLFSLPCVLGSRREVAQVLLRGMPFFTLLVGWCVLSVGWAIDPGIAFRRILATVMVLIVLLSCVAVRPKDLVGMVIFTLGFVMVVDYAGLVLIPEGSRSWEGLWKGMHIHKNVAGYFAALAALIWFQAGILWPQKRWTLFWPGALLWAVFLVFTGSKTSIALLGIVLPISLLAIRVVWRGMNWPLASVALGFVLAMLAPLAYAGYALLVGGDVEITLTGRTDIWSFVLSKIAEAPWLGWGFGSFWAIGDMSPSLVEGTEDLANFTQAHNGFLDIWVSTGLIGLMLLLLAILTPVKQVLAGKPRPFDPNEEDYRLLSVFGVTMLAFGIFHNTSETSFLQGLVAMWPFSLMGIIMIARASLLRKP